MLGQPLIPKDHSIVKYFFEGHGFKAGVNKNTSIASLTSRVIVRKIEKKYGAKIASKLGKKFAVRFFMRAGGLFGRAVPGIGWGISAYDAYDNRQEIGEFIGEMQKTNEANKNNLMWHVR